MRYLEWDYGRLGIVGMATDIKDCDGNSLFIGDMVTIICNGEEQENPSVVVVDRDCVYVMGLKELTFRGLPIMYHSYNYNIRLHTHHWDIPSGVRVRSVNYRSTSHINCLISKYNFMVRGTVV